MDLESVECYFKTQRTHFPSTKSLQKITAHKHHCLDFSRKNSVPDFQLKDFPPATLTERLAWEKELLGLYISGHPLQAFEDKFKKKENTIAHIKTLGNGTPVVVGGLVIEVKNIMTKKNEAMAFVKLGDLNDVIEVVVFPKTLAEYKNLFLVDKIIAVKGSISHRNDTISVMADAAKELTK